MAGYQNLLGGDASIRSLINESRNTSALFKDATWDKVGTDEALTSFLHGSMDPSGDKYGGNTDLLKQDLLNTGTTKSNSAIASIWDAIGARSEGQEKKQFENLVGRLYENAPNRLVSGNANDTYQAVKSGLIGAVGIDAPLNIAITLATGGLGFGAKNAAVNAATRALGREGTQTAITSGIAREAGSSALLSQAAEQASKSAAWDVARQYGKTEAAEGFIGGAIGDYAEQTAKVERELQQDTSLGQAALGGVLGAGVGGILGTAAGRLGEGRKLGNELAQGIDGRAAVESDILKAMPDGQKSIMDAVAYGQRNEGPQTPEGWQPGRTALDQPPGGVEFNASRDTYTEFNSDVESAHSELSVFQNKVASGRLQSQYTPEQIAALRDGVARMRDMDALAEAHLNQARTLKEQGTPESVAAANESSLKAAQLQSSVNRVLNGDFNSEKIFNDAGDIDPSLQAWLTANDPAVAAAFSPVPVKGAAKAAPAPVESAPVATQNVASSAPAPAPAPVKTLDERIGALTTEAASIDTAVAKAATPAAEGVAPAAPRALTPVESAIKVASSSAPVEMPAMRQAVSDAVAGGRTDVASVIVERAEQAAVNGVGEDAAALRAMLPPESAPAAATPTVQVTEQVATPASGAPTAQEITTLSEAFEPADKQAVADINALAAQAGTDLQGVLDSMAKLGSQSQAITKVVDDAKAKGVTVDRAAVEQAMTKVTAATQKARSRATEATTEAPPAKTPEEMIAEGKAGIAAHQPEIDKLATVAAKQQYQALQKTVDDQIAQADKALDTLMAAVEKQVADDVATFGEAAEKLSKVDKSEIVKQALKQAVADNPDLAPLIGMLDSSKLTSAKGIKKAKADLVELALDTISWSYAKTVGDVLSDPLNTSHFDTVIDAMLEGVPSDRVARIKADYTKMVNNALVARIEAIGIANVQADPRLNAVLERMTSTDASGVKQYGAKATSKVEVGSMVNQYADRILAQLSETGSTAPLKDLQKHLEKAAGAVRDFHKHFVDAGLPESFFASQMYLDAMHVKARNAVEYELSDAFRTNNAGDFEKMGQMAALRERDQQKGKFARTPSHARNMFFGGFDENPVLHRVMDEHGNPNDQIVSGRTITTGPLGVRQVGKPQGILSDGISEYLGFLWAQPRKMFTAAAMARKSIYGAAVENTNWARGSLMIDGKLEKGVKKELIGRYSENINQRMAQSRFNLILDAVERKALADTTDERYLSADDFTKQIELIGSRGQAVTTDELAVATGFINHKNDMATSMSVQRSSLTEAIDQAKAMGESPAAAINAVMDKMVALMKKADKRMVGLMAQADELIAPKAIAGRSKGRKGQAEGAATGTAAKETTRTAKDQNVRDYNSLTVEVKVKRGDKTELVKMNVVPNEAMALNVDGSIYLFGEKIGTWRTAEDGEKGGRGIRYTIDGLATYTDTPANDLTSIMKSGSFLKRFESQMERNTAKMTPSSEAEAALPTGSVIDSAVASTKEVADAKRELLNPSVVTAADMDRTVGSYTVPEGRALMVRDKSNGAVERPGPNQGDMTIGAWLKRVGIDQADAEIGTGVAEVQRKNGTFVKPNLTERKAGFTSLGRDTGTADPAVVKAVLERDAGVAPTLLAARTRPISILEAGKIKLDDGNTLADLVTGFDASTLGLQWSKIPDLGTLQVVIASLQKQADQIAALAPYGVKLDNASRRTSFSGLEKAMGQFSLAERQQTLDMLRRLDAERSGLPYFYKGGETGNDLTYGGTGAGTSRISVGGARDGGIPKHIIITHEVGHWAFVNMLTPQERIQFLQSLAKHYKADGTIDIMGAMPNAKAVEQALGKKFDGNTTNTNELFAWQFTSWYMDKVVGKAGAAAEASLWEKVVNGAKNLLAHFMGSPVDRDLVPLFERILPSTIGESKFTYGTLTDNRTGEVVDPKAITQDKRKGVALVADIMQKIDEKRSVIAQHMFTPGAMVEAGFAADLEVAARHMFGLLYGHDRDMNPGKTVKGLRSKLLKSGKEGNSAPAPGAIDPSKMFDKHSMGGLMTTIKGIIPDQKMGDDIAFEAMSEAEEFMVQIKDNSMNARGDFKTEYLKTLQTEFTRLTSGLKMDEISQNQAAKYTEVLEAAQLVAEKAVADLARMENIDIDKSIWDGGDRIKLGDDQQREVLGAMARNLYDLMSDSLDHLESKVEGFGYRLQRNTRQVALPERTPEAAAFEKAVEKEVSKVKVKKARTKVAPKDAASAEVVAKEELERFDGVATGVPAGAPAEFHAMVGRVPHRDPVQSGIIGTLMHRLFSRVMPDGDLTAITNADIYRLVGDQGLRQADESKGFKPDAFPSDESESFAALRRSMRSASEFLTNGNIDPAGAIAHVQEILARQEVAGEGVRFSMDDLMDAVKLYGEGRQPANMDEALLDAAANVYLGSLEVLSDLGTSARAKRATGDAVVQTPGRPVALRYSNGMYHSATAAQSVQTRLSQLPETVARALLDSIGVKPKDGQTLAQALSDSIGYGVFRGSDKRVIVTKDQLADSMADTRFEETDALLVKLMGEGKMDEAQALLVTREAQAKVAQAVDGVEPVLISMDNVLDVAMATDVQAVGLMGAYRKAMAKLSAGGDAGAAAKVQADLQRISDGQPGAAMVEAIRRSAGEATFNKLLKEMGYKGVLNGETITLLKGGATKSLEAEIAKATKSMPKEDATNVPLVGEIVLHMALDEGARVNPMAAEHRALQGGATPAVAGIFSNFFKSKRSPDGLTEPQAQAVRSFHGLQLMSNAARIGRAGADYLRNLIAPAEGTGFEDALKVKMSSSLMPINAEIDRLAGLKTWYAKSFNEIVRNLKVTDHAVPQSPMELSVTMAMRKNSIDGLSMQEKTLALNMKKHFKSLLNMQREAGVPVGDLAGDGFYLPQRFNLEWINHNRDEAIKMLGDWFIKDRGGEVGTARADAARVINDAINKQELQGFLDSSNSVYTQAFGDKLHSRKLNIEGADWEKMAPMFDNNLRSLLISYTEAAHKRVEWSERFGIRGHGINTYVDIADRGGEAAIDAFTGVAQGMSYVSGGVKGNDVPSDGMNRSVEFTDSLFTPMAKSKEEAAALTVNVMNLLEQNSSKASRAGIVEMIVAKYMAEGGSGEMHFRKRAEAIVNGLADFGDQGGTVARAELDFMLKMTGTLEGRAAHTIMANQGLRDAAGAVKAFNSISLLSGAVLSSLADPVLSLVRSGSASSWLKGMTSAVKLASKDPANAAAMMRVGVGMEAILNENLTHVNGGISGRWSNAFFQGTLLTPWTTANRQVAALVGFESIKANQAIVHREKFSNNLDSYQYRKSMRYLRQLGLAELANAKKIDSFAEAMDASYPNSQKLAEAVHKFVNESVFQPNRNDIPLWAQDPIASIFWQFKSFPMMMGRLVKHNVKEAFAASSKKEGEYASIFTKGSGKYEGDPSGLLYLLTVGAAAGYGSLYVKDHVLGKNQEAEDGEWRSTRERSLSKIAQEFGFKDYEMDNPVLDTVMGNYVNGLMGLGALGFLGDLMFQSAKSVDNGAFGRERIMSQIGGPTLGLFSDALQMIEGGKAAIESDEEGGGKERNAVRKVLKRIPVVGGQDPWVEPTVDWFAGEAANPR